MKLKRIIVLVLSFLIMFSSIQIQWGMAADSKIVLDNQLLNGYKKVTPKENLFSTEDHPNKYFVLLDSDETGFLLLANEIYSTKAFDPDGTQKFDPSDENNIAYYLNNTLINDSDLFPAEIKEYIDFTRCWNTEAGSSLGNCPEPYSTVCGVSLLSYSEFMKYYQIIGLQDPNLKVDWYLRSPLGSSVACDAGISIGGTYSTLGKFSSISTTISLGVRPVFWVHKDFFKDVRINIPFLGEEVAKKIRLSFKKEELKEGKAMYSDYALKRLGYKMNDVADEYIDIFFPNDPMYIQNQKDAYVEVYIIISGNKASDYVIEYSKDGTFTDTVSQKATVYPYKRLELKLDLSVLNKGKYPNFTVRVASENGIAAVKSIPLTIMEFVEKQPLAEYSRIGMNWHIDYNTADYISGTTDVFGESVENYNKLMNMMGFIRTRSIHRWEWSETTKGDRRNGRHSYLNGLMTKYGQTFSPYILGFRNPLYYPEEPRTYEDVMATMEYCTDILDYLMNRGVKIYDLEIWNEPNLVNFWRSYRTITYSQFANRLAFEMNKLYPDIPIMGGAISTTGNYGVQGYEYLDEYFRRGALMYVGGYSFHPYIYPNNPDERHMKRAKEFISVRDDVGGWLEVSQTETGFPTNKAAEGVSPATQALYVPKVCIYSDEMDIYLTNLWTLADTGWDENYREHNFGFIGLDLIPKETVVSLAQLQKYCANANYIGRYPINEKSYAYVYSKLDKLFAIVWSESVDESYEYKPEHGVKVEDLYGNPIELVEGKINIGSSLVYLDNVPIEYLAKATEYQVKSGINDLVNEFLDEVDTEQLKKLTELFKEDSNKSKVSLKAGIDALYAYGRTLISLYKQNPGNLELKRLSLLLYKIHQIAKKASFAYSYFDVDFTSSDKEYRRVAQLIKEKKGDEPDSSLLYTDAIMRFAHRYNKQSNDISENYKNNFPGKKGVKAALDIMASNLSLWAEGFMELEKVDTSRAVFTYLEDTDPTVYGGLNFEYFIEVENFRKKDINGTVVWRDSQGNAIGPESECIVKSGNHETIYFSGTIPSDYPTGDQIFYVDIMEHGKLLKRSEMQCKVQKKVFAELDDSMLPVGSMTDVTVNVTNTYNQTVMGTVEIETPSGWELETNSKRFVAQAGQVQQVNFKVNKVKRVPYNEYVFKFAVKDQEGNILMQGEQLLNFRIAVKANQEIDIQDFDGDISGWENAYPIYIDPPNNPEDLEMWKNAGIAVKSLMKWDDNYFYVLTDVYDDLYAQSYTGSKLWQGDSIQLAFDTLNDKTGAYGADDYEYGFSHTALGIEVQGFAVAASKTAGSKPASWVRIVRDDENNVTRYLVKIPKEELTPMKFSEGYVFGYNLCVNDADIFERDSVIQFTLGISGTKNTKHFKNFKLVGNESEISIDESAEAGFIRKINNHGFSGKNK